MFPVHQIDYVSKKAHLTVKRRAEHIEAARKPRDHEKPIVNAIEAWIMLATQYFKRTRRNIGSVPQDLEPWARMGMAIKDIIACYDIGRLSETALIALIEDNIEEQTSL